ncbi:SAM-dependent methyltransferase (plasmid) [Paenibacillus sonchi]|uniref:SAM-dependent methyltransferase n=1 Tax=Paenibacillus sonchi TaxID=373687 RepID=A0A974PIL9_9BACL|nr:DUF6094 domain-containing protein [Paenibacillus sonchi]QQZ64531.1 SAM-dependent methyltransferase [Paenibacillus sonchi]
MNDLKGMFNRIANNKIRMGNYETIEEDLVCLRSLLQFPNTPFSIVDFCAGSGRAIETLAKESTAVTFGIEPNEEKYLELRERVDFALYGGYEECRMNKDTFRLCYLNPPYDRDSETLESKVERKEKRFLRQLLPYVSTDGILIYNIPRRWMKKDIVTLLVANLDDIRIFQSHDDTYQQVYTIGRKRREKYIDRNLVLQILDLMDEENHLQRLPVSDEPLYKVQPGNVAPKYFRSMRMDVDQLRAVIQESALTHKGMLWTTPKKPAAKLQPLLPDKEMHRVLRMASGRLNGKVGSGYLLHVLKGIVKKELQVSTETIGNEVVETEKEVFKITFKLIDRFGNIRKIEN